MKMLLCLFVICAAITAAAQNGPLLHIKPKAGYNDSIPNSPALMDTANMYNSKYGKVARLTQDNMPCIIPYNTTIEIPNATGCKQIPQDIPNAWRGRKYPTPYFAPHSKNNMPGPWKDPANKK